MKIVKAATVVLAGALATVAVAATVATAPASATGADTVQVSQSFKINAARYSGDKIIDCPVGYYIPGTWEQPMAADEGWFEPDIAVSGDYITNGLPQSDVGVHPDHDNDSHYRGVMVDLYNWSILSSHTATVSFTCHAG
jgi:hypothetical protein